MAALTPQAVLQLSEPIEQVYSNVVDALLVNLAKHFKSGKALSTQAWEIKKLSELGQLNKESVEIIAELTGQTPEMVAKALENAVIAADPVKMKGATIYIVGQNTITSSSGTGIYVAKGCSVTIISDDRVSNALTVTGKITGIGGSANEDEVLDCGDITIRNVTLSASTDSESIYVSYGSVHRPGIGAVGTAACGTITIDNSTVTAYGSGDYSNRSAAAIGGGLVGSSIGGKISISISNSDIYAHRNCSVGNYIGQGGHFQSAQKGQIDADVKNSTIHKYTSDTYDGQTVYGDDGSIIE